MPSPAASENKMGVMPVKKLVISMSWPIMVSMLVQALYNIVDSIFVTKISEGALTAVSMAFPIQFLMIAIGAGLGVGVNAMLSKALGEKNYKKVNSAAMHGLFLSICNFIIFFIVGIFLVKPFYAVQINDTVIIAYGTEYLTVVCCMSIGFFFQMISERLLLSTGKTALAMFVQILGAVFNIIMDPILIFGWFGFPEMGVRGAALATVLGQTFAAFVGIIINIKINGEIHFSIKKFKPSTDDIFSIYKVGLPSTIMQAIGSLMNFTMNNILVGFSSTAVAVFGVYFKLQSFILLPVIGLNNGIIPIIAYNYGARKRSRIIQTIKFSSVITALILVIGTLLFETFPKVLLSLFDVSDTMMDMGVPALRIIALHFPLAAFSIIFISTFQALSKAVYSMVISICRQLVVLLPAAWILAKVTKDVNAVWFSFLIAEVVSFALAIGFMVITYRIIIKNIPDNK